jgi:hypothetical protein
MEKEGKERERESESWNRGVVSAVAREVDEGWPAGSAD